MNARLPGTRVHGFAGSRFHEFAGSRVGCTGSQVRGFARCTGSHVHGFAGSRAAPRFVSTGDEIILFFPLWSAHALLAQLWFGHGCSADRMLSEYERNYDLGMDALVIVYSSYTNGNMVWI